MNSSMRALHSSECGFVTLCKPRILASVRTAPHPASECTYTSVVAFRRLLPVQASPLLLLVVASPQALLQ